VRKRDDGAVTRRHPVFVVLSRGYFGKNTQTGIDISDDCWYNMIAGSIKNRNED
jgi:hypothetical protein